MRVQQNGRIFSSALVVTLLLVTAGTLAAQDVRYNFMPGADFSKYHTYKWVNIGGAHPDQVVDAEIKQAVDSQLAARGMTKTDNDKADLYIGYQTAVHQERQWNAWGTRSFGMGTGSLTSSTISIGTLVLDMYDPGAKQLVWTGSATNTIDTGSNHEKHMKKLNKAMGISDVRFVQAGGTAQVTQGQNSAEEFLSPHLKEIAAVLCENFCIIVVATIIVITHLSMKRKDNARDQADGDETD